MSGNLIRCQNGHLFSSRRYGTVCPYCNIETATKEKKSVEKSQEEIEDILFLEEENPVCGWIVCVKGPRRGKDYRVMDGKNIVGLWDVAHDRSLFETGNAIALDGGLTLESLLQELSSTGKGDVSEPFVCMTHANGSTTCDFVYESYEIKNGRDELEGLPCAVEYHRGTDGRFNTVNEQQGTEVGSGVAGGLQSIQAYERQNTAGEVTQLTITLRDKFYRQQLVWWIQFQRYQDDDACGGRV